MFKCTIKCHSDPLRTRTVAEIQCAPNNILQFVNQLESVRNHSLHQPIRHAYLLLAPAFQLQRGCQHAQLLLTKIWDRRTWK
jgi:hypothetical protein